MPRKRKSQELEPVQKPEPIQTILEIITADLLLITDKEIERVAVSLDDPIEESDEVLVEVPPSIRALYALQYEYVRRSKLAIHAVQFDITDPIAKAAVEAKARRYIVIAEVIQNIAWAEAREAAGMKAWTVGHLALRKDWFLVSCQKSKSDEDDSQELRGFTIPIPAGALDLVRTIFQRLGTAEEPEKPEMKKKPQ